MPDRSKGRRMVTVEDATAIAQDAIRMLEAQRDEARAEHAEFVRRVTERLNRLGVPASPSWPEAFDWLEAEVERLHQMVETVEDHCQHHEAEVERLREVAIKAGACECTWDLADDGNDEIVRPHSECPVHNGGRFS